MNKMVRTPYVGSAQRRVDGALKVTGGATYAAEFGADDLAHGYVVSSAITKGKIATIDTAAALAVPGVIDVLTHANRPAAPFERESFQDAVAPPGVPFRPLESGQIVYGGQPVALVVAETFEAARHAASLVAITYVSEAPMTDLAVARADAYDPPEKRAGIAPPPKPWGNADKALRRRADPHRAGLPDRDRASPADGDVRLHRHLARRGRADDPRQEFKASPTRKTMSSRTSA